MANVLLKSDIPGARLRNRGKVRDIYDAGEHLLIVASDRISAFDVVMAEGIPGKGAVLTQISKFWFSLTRDLVPNHFVTDEVREFPAPFNRYPDQLQGRAMLVKKAQPLPVECIVRGYLAGSGWKEYRKSGTLHKTRLPAGLQESSRLPEPLFTPSTKAEEGHDENITFEEMLKLVNHEIAEAAREKSLQIYRRGVEVAEEKGIIIADTKFEFGLVDGELILIDEALTPDSSRFWPKEQYQPGKSQPSYDKQYLRDYLETLDWGKTPPPPELPETVVQNTSRKYQEILRILTGKSVL
ncbi:MAG: phosphoribosylaminoimidazolesuccinocarboxamide synthase [Calditrichaceae bacterium]|nr:phosphoribosylaminoimidazolesuccinocarboxamide synthase [Calditrichia bacterium]NUQ42516.1 phosphoribosylaminoimidazolesuccinocarboxamide synthase [Calditrichaceae bacterium]